MAPSQPPIVPGRVRTVGFDRGHPFSALHAPPAADIVQSVLKGLSDVRSEHGVHLSSAVWPKMISLAITNAVADRIR